MPTTPILLTSTKIPSQSIQEHQSIKRLPPSYEKDLKQEQTFYESLENEIKYLPCCNTHAYYSYVDGTRRLTLSCAKCGRLLAVHDNVTIEKV